MSGLSTEELAAKKAAKAAYDREYRARNAEKIKAAKKAWSRTEAGKRQNAAWHAAHPESNRNSTLKRTEKKREYMRLRYAADPEAARAYGRAYYANNRHAFIARANARKAHVAVATPAWANMRAIAEIYRLAAEQGMHVDHIVPLRGKLVCGLHVETNLQLLPPRENLRKGNKHAS